MESRISDLHRVIDIVRDGFQGAADCIEIRATFRPLRVDALESPARLIVLGAVDDHGIAAARHAAGAYICGPAVRTHKHAVQRPVARIVVIRCIAPRVLMADDC